MKLAASEVKPGVLRIALDGRLDAPSAQAIEDEFLSALDNANHVIVDFTNVSFVGSIGIRLLMTGAKAKAKSKKGGKMVMAIPDTKIRWVMKTSGVDQLVPVFDDAAAAEASFV